MNAAKWNASRRLHQAVKHSVEGIGNKTANPSRGVFWCLEQGSVAVEREDGMDGAGGWGGIMDTMGLFCCRCVTS